MSKRSLVVIGGGAAGFFCAVNAARMNPALEVIIIEKSNKLLSKVKVSGGGRCNVTNACTDIDEMIKKYPRGGHFLRKGFHVFFTGDTIEWFESRGVKLKTEADQRVFPKSDSSQTILNCLFEEARRYGVQIWTNTELKGISKDGENFNLLLAGGRTFAANMVCIASGGYPKSSMFDWIRKLGIAVEDPVPSLFTFNMPGNPITALMGNEVDDAGVSILGTKLKDRGPLLITHWGMSGPAILRLSAWGARELAGSSAALTEPYQFTLQVCWLPEFNESLLRERIQDLRTAGGSAKIMGKSPFGLPQRLWVYLMGKSGISENTRWADLTSKAQYVMIKGLLAHEFQVSGKTTFKEEFVTAGGIRLSEIDPMTMECKKVPGLFFAGEVMNVDGITGGFNFQHAWTSGYIAARSTANR